MKLFLTPSSMLPFDACANEIRHIGMRCKGACVDNRKMKELISLNELYRTARRGPGGL